MNERKRFLEAHDYYDRQDLGYFDEYTGQGLGCSNLQVLCLRRAGIISETESFHAASGYVGVLGDTSRFQRLPANTKQIDGDIQWYQYSHVSCYNSKGGKYPYGRNEAAPKDRHPANDRGGEVGFWHNHNYECASVPLTCIFRIIEKGDDSMFTQEQIEAYLAEAYKIAKDDSHGYNNTVGKNLGPVDFDCGGFVSHCLQVAGLFKSGAVFEPNLSDNTWGYDKLLTAAGFVKHTYNAATVKRGDILIKSGRHTEIATGSGKQIGSRNDYDNRQGDSSGNEISEVALYTNYWDYMYRLPVDEEPTHSVLQYGSTGNEVKTLQAMLNEKNSAGLAVDGSFGKLTEEAVKNFQKRNDLTVDGIVGPITWNKLLSIQPMPEPVTFSVEEWQKAAKADGLYTGDIDGLFGPLSTKAANAGVYLGCKYKNLITFWQTWLSVNKYYTGNIDGSFGPMTRTAVYTAQGAYGLAQDACIGPASTKAFLHI